MALYNISTTKLMLSWLLSSSGSNFGGWFYSFVNYSFREACSWSNLLFCSYTWTNLLRFKSFYTISVGEVFINKIFPSPSSSWSHSSGFHFPLSTSKIIPTYVETYSRPVIIAKLSPSWIPVRLVNARWSRFYLFGVALEFTYRAFGYGFGIFCVPPVLLICQWFRMVQLVVQQCECGSLTESFYRELGTMVAIDVYCVALSIVLLDLALFNVVSWFVDNLVRFLISCWNNCICLEGSCLSLCVWTLLVGWCVWKLKVIMRYYIFEFNHLKQ